MRVLITGITGFAGSHLADYILAEYPEVQVSGIMCSILKIKSTWLKLI